MSRKEAIKTNIQLENDELIQRFLSAQTERTKKTYTSNFKKVIEYSGQSGKEILDNHDDWSTKIFAFQQWLVAQKYSYSTVQSQIGMLRGYFSFYHKPIQFSKTETRKLNKKKRNSDDYLFSQADIKKMSEVGSLKEKYVLFIGTSFGLRSEDAVKLTYGQYRRAIERSKEIPIALDPVNTAKEDVLAHPFISSDLFPIVTAILDSNKNAKDEDLVFTENPQQLTRILQQLVIKAGIDAHGMRVRYHSLRKYLFSKLNVVSSSEQSKMIIGKMVTSSDAVYLNTDSLRDVYVKAMPSICVSNGNGETKAKVSALEQENLRLKEEVKKLTEEKTKTDDILKILIKKQIAQEPQEHQETDMEHAILLKFLEGKKD